MAKPKEKQPKEKYIASVGRRKSASARARLLFDGKGEIEINGKKYTDYFPYEVYQQKVFEPLRVVGKEKDFNFSIKIEGGGPKGQAEACALAIARALIKFNTEDYKKTLRVAGLLTRDPRVKERKKAGLKKARRAPQWSKR